MNKIYKLVWSKVKNCYIVTSELAKSHTKSPASSTISKSIVAGVLAGVLNCGVSMPVFAAAYNAGGGTASGTDAVAIGYESDANSDYSIAIGNNADVSGLYSIAIGKDVVITGENSGAIGEPITLDADFSYVIGNDIAVQENVKNVFVLGNNVNVSNGDEIDVGEGAIAIGDNVSISLNNKATESRSGSSLESPRIEHVVAIGDGTIIGEENAIAIGHAAQATALNTFAVGDEAKAIAEGANAIGHSALANDAFSNALGYQAQAIGEGSAAFGQDAQATVKFATAFGRQTRATAESATAIGNNAKAISQAAVAIGVSSLANGGGNTHVVAIGNQARVGKVDTSGVPTSAYGEATAIGGAAKVEGNYGTSIGASSSVTQQNATAIGYNASVTAQNAVAVGANSVAGTADTFSVGSSSATRKIVNVTDGTTAHDVSTIGQTGNKLSYSGNTLSLKTTTGTTLSSVTINAGSSHTAGDGLQLVGDEFSAKAGTNVIVNSNGISVTGSGTVASANTGLLSGGTAYTELRPTDGNYVKLAKTTAENLTALDTQIKSTDNTAIKGLSVSGKTITYTKGDGTTGTITTQDTTYGNMSATELSTGTATTARSISAKVVSDFVLDKVNTEATARTDADTLLSNRIGSLSANGSYIKKSSSKNVIDNLSILDAQLKMTNDNIAGFAADITRNKNNIQSLNTSVSSALSSVGAASTVIDLLNTTKADTSLNNLTAGGKRVIATAAMDAVQEYMASQGGTNSLTAPAYATPSAPMVVDDSNSNNNTNNIRTLSTRNIATSMSADIGDNANNVTTVSTHNIVAPMLAGAGDANTNYVVYDDGSADTITLEGPIGTGTKIKNVADGELSAASKEAVNGSQLYAVTQQFDEFQSALSQNNTSIAVAQTDINNIKSANIILQSDVNTLKTQMEDGFNVTVGGGLIKKVNPNSNYINFTNGDNVTIENDNESVKISVTANGTIANGDTSPVSGGTVYNDTRVASDGNYVESGNTVAQNFTVLDTALKQVEDLAQQAAQSGTDANAVHYDGTDKSLVTLLGANGTKLTNLKDGTVSANSKDAITGKQLYQTNQALNDETINRINADNALSDRIGILSSDGTYISKNKNVSDNLKALDTGLQTISDGIANAVQYDDNSHTSVTFGDGTTPVALHNVADAELSTTSTDAVNGKQLFTTNERVGTLEQNVNDLQNNSANKDLSNITNAGKEVIRDVVSADLDQKANKDASNIETLKWQEKLGDGKAEAGNTGLINGDTLYKETRPSYDGMFVKMDNSVGDNLLLLDTTVNELSKSINNRAVHNLSVNSINPDEDTNYNSTGATGDDAVAIGVSASATGNEAIALGHNAQANGEMSIALGYGNEVNGDHSGAFGDPNVVNGADSYVIGNNNTVDGNNTFVFSHNNIVTGNNSVILGAGSDGTQDNVVSVGAKDAERKIIFVADGEIKADSKDAVNGGQLYQVQQDLQNANGINVDKWSEKLGTGLMEEGNTGLINGNTLYKVMENYQGTDLISLDKDNNSIHIGGLDKYNGVDTVDFSQADGSSRVLTGIATNPNDATSAANVGYVNAIGQNIVNNVNDGFNRMNDKVGKAGASAAAMASLPTPPMDGDEKWALSASVGHYDGKTSGAVGAFYKPQDNVILNIRGAVGNGEEMIGAGVGVALSRGNTPSVTKAQLVRTINAQAGKIQEMIARDNAREAEMQQMKAQMAAMADALQRLSEAQNK